MAKVSANLIKKTALKLLADEPSLASLSLRTIATALKIDVSTIYWYFENKQALLQAMADYIANQITFPSSDLAWQEQLAQLYTNIFDVYARYPHAAELMISTIPATKARLQLIDHAIGILVTAGFDESQSNTAIVSIDFLLTGLVIDLTTENQFRAQIKTTSDDYLTKQVHQIHALAKEEHLIHMQASIKQRNVQTPKQQFEAGMRLIIKGLSANNRA